MDIDVAIDELYAAKEAIEFVSEELLRLGLTNTQKIAFSWQK